MVNFSLYKYHRKQIINGSMVYWFKNIKTNVSYPFRLIWNNFYFSGKKLMWFEGLEFIKILGNNWDD